MDTALSPLIAFFENPTVKSVLWAAVIALATYAVARVAARALRHLLNHDSNPLPSASIIVNLARACIWLGGASIALDACFGINANAIVTALGVGGIAVSLGFQDTLSNLIGGLQVTFMGIISPGDNIEVGSQTGVVQDITWRHTTIKDSLGQVVVIPNSIISKTALVHLLPANRVAVPFTIARYKDGEDGQLDAAGDLDALSEQIVAASATAIGRVSPVIDGPRVFFSEIAELGIKGKVIFQVEDAGATSRAADAVVRAIARTLK